MAKKNKKKNSANKAAKQAVEVKEEVKQSAEKAEVTEQKSYNTSKMSSEELQAMREQIKAELKAEMLAEKKSDKIEDNAEVSADDTKEEVKEDTKEKTKEEVKEDTKKKDEKKAEKKETSVQKKARKLPTIKEREQSKTRLFLILSFLVPFIIMGVMFAKAGIYPFGERQAMYSDCKQQYLPFLKEFQRKLKSGDSLLYSWRNGLGTNFIAMIGYYIASPLNWLTLFVPVKYVREAMAVFMMAKIGCASLFTAIFLKYVYKRNDLSLVAFGCCYAFCDFFMGYYWNVIWLDSVALLPLIALGAYRVVREGKFKLYVISLAIAFLSSYYIGYMICVFVLIWFVVLSIAEKTDFDKLVHDFIKMGIYSVIGLMLTMPISLTSYIQLQNTVGTDDKFPKKVEFYNNFMEMLANLMSFHKTTTMEGLPNVGTGVVCILLLVIFVRSKNIEKREKITYLSLLGFMFVSLNVNVLDFIWHGFHFPNLIPYRFAFIFSFVFVIIAYKAFSAFSELDKKDIIGMCILTIIMVCISVFYLDSKAVIGSLIVAASYILMMTFYEFKLIDKRILTILASVLIIVEMCIECSVGVSTVGTTSHNNYPDKEESVAELVKYAEEQNGNEFFRIDQTNYSTKNDGMIYGYNGVGQFSSTSYKNLITFTSRFGMVSKRSSYQYLLTSPVTSMYMGIKYVISRDNYIGGERALTEVKESSDGNVKMYLNEYNLPIAYMADNASKNINMENDNVFLTQNEVFKGTTGVNKDVYTLLKPDSFDCLNMEHKEDSEGMYSYSYTSGNNSGEINVTYVAQKDGSYYAWANIKSSKKIEVKGSIRHTYDIESQRYIFPVGYYHKGDRFTLHVESTTSGKNIIGAAYLDNEVLDEGYAQLNDEGLKVTRYTSSVIEGTIDVQKDGVMLTSIPYERGWKLFIDGEKVDTEESMEAFLSADVKKGKHNVKLVYSPQGFKAGVFFSVIAILLFAALCFNERLKMQGKKSFEWA